MKKILCSVLAVLMLMSLCGCNAGKTNGKQELVKLKWVAPGEDSEEANLVEQEINKIFAEQLGVVVEFEKIPFSEYSTRWDLMVASKENVDLAWTGWLCDLNTQVYNGSYMELDELLETEGKDLLDEIPEWAWLKESIDGKIYAVPNMQQFNESRLCMFTQKKYSDKYLDKEKLIEVSNASPSLTEESYDILETYLKSLKDNGELNYGVSTSSFANGIINMNFETIIGNFGIVRNDDKLKIAYKYETDDAKLCFEKMNDWFKKGYIRQDIANVTNKAEKENQEDGNVIWSHSYYDGIDQVMTKGHFFDIEAVPLAPDFYIASNACNTATVIPVMSKHPEEAMKVLNFINSEKGAEFGIMNLIAHGIEGKHYKLNKETGKADVLRDEKKTPYYWENGWVYGNTYYMRERDSELDNWNTYVRDVMNEGAVKSKIMGFKPDASHISTQLAHITSIEGEFYSTLRDGCSPDYKSVYNDMFKKLKIAGIDDIKAELQAQLDAYVKTIKK